MKLPVLLSAGVVAPVIFAAMPALAQDGPTAPGTITGRAAIGLVIGNSLVHEGQDQDKTAQEKSTPAMVMHFAADGKAGARSADTGAEVQPGTWSIDEQGRLCVVDPGKTPKEGDCVDVAVTGDQVRLTQSLERMELNMRLVPGNPYEL